MVAYYNENNSDASNWLKKLIKNKLLPEGDVDTRSIIDVKAEDLRGYEQCHFFAGIGGWALALKQAGWGERAVWTSSLPCQPFSGAGNQQGFNDKRHLWKCFFKLVQECKPNTIFGEQVSSKIALAWLDVVQTDLENENYTVGTLDLCAASVGAPHIRQRLYWVADTTTRRRWEKQSNTPRLLERVNSAQYETGGSCTSSSTDNFWGKVDWVQCRDDKWRAIEPGTKSLVNGVPNRMVKLRGYGNAIVVPLAKMFIESYMEIDER